jgi:hypothetical protein
MYRLKKYLKCTESTAFYIRHYTKLVPILALYQPYFKVTALFPCTSNFVENYDFYVVSELGIAYVAVFLRQIFNVFSTHMVQ